MRQILPRAEVRTVVIADGVENEWDPVMTPSVPEVLYSFGRAGQVDEDGLRCLVGSVKRYLGEPGDDPTATWILEPVDSRPAGGELLMGGLWRQLGLHLATPNSAKPRPEPSHNRLTIR